VTLTLWQARIHHYVLYLYNIECYLIRMIQNEDVWYNIMQHLVQNIYFFSFIENNLLIENTSFCTLKKTKNEDDGEIER